MINLDEDALICDFAETYHVLDYKGLRARTAGALACGLRSDSRIMQRLTHYKVSLDELMLASIADRLSVLIWQNTKDGQKGVNVPEMITDSLTEMKKETAFTVFDSGEDFTKAWEKMMRG